jgi:hypothetical protein
MLPAGPETRMPDTSRVAYMGRIGYLSFDAKYLSLSAGFGFPAKTMRGVCGGRVMRWLTRNNADRGGEEEQERREFLGKLRVGATGWSPFFGSAGAFGSVAPEGHGG